MNGDPISSHTDSPRGEENSSESKIKMDALRRRMEYIQKQEHKDTSKSCKRDEQEQTMLDKRRQKDREFSNLLNPIERAELDKRREITAEKLRTKLRETNYSKSLDPQEIQDIRDLLNTYKDLVVKPANKRERNNT